MGHEKRASETTEPGLREPVEQADLADALLRWSVQVAVLILLWSACLFLSSGRLDWVMAWVYLGLFAASQVVTAIVLMRRSPLLLADRARSTGPRDLDRVLAGIMALYGPVAILVVAGLDMRFGWSPQLPVILRLVILAVVVLSYALTIWAMASNRFFYGVLRIAPGHSVASAGPYRIVRHPGNLGAILFQLGTPVLLVSLWALMPAVLVACATVARTAMEDRALRQTLDGYRGYAQRVGYRLLPGVW